MKNYNNNSTLSSEEVRLQQLNANQTVENIQNISRNIREYSLQMRQTMKTLRESGAIPEVALAIRDGSFVARDIAKNISETVQEFKRNGIVHETANAVENTLKSAEESMTTVKDLATVAGKTSPHTIQTVKDGVDTVRKETSHVTTKVMKGIKNKVEA
jgi:methyl-accepting chemotaxis protein